MLSIHKNIFIAYFSRGWAVLLTFLLTPLYVHILGIESYALIGITFSIQAVLCLFDFGFGGATTLHTAALAAEGKQGEMRNLFRTGEILYWGAALVLLALFWFFSDLVAAVWFSHISAEKFALGKIIALMGGIVICQWPCLFYSGALLGLQRQDIVNKINMGLATFRSALTLFILTCISPTVEAFLLVQMGCGLGQTLTSACALWSTAKGGFFQGQFDRHLFRETGKKALKLSAILVLGVALFHIDKIVLSRFFDLKTLGYYCFAWTLVHGFYSLCALLNTIFGPRLAHSAAEKNESALLLGYHQGAQWMSLLIFPLALFFIFFSKEILLYWCRDPLLVENTYGIASLLIAGTGFHCLTMIPQCLQLAHQWMKLAMAMNALFLILYVPLLFFLRTDRGDVGSFSAVGALAMRLFFCFWPLYASAPSSSGRKEMALRGYRLAFSRGCGSRSAVPLSLRPLSAGKERHCPFGALLCSDFPL